MGTATVVGLRDRTEWIKLNHLKLVERDENLGNRENSDGKRFSARTSAAKANGENS